MNPFQQFWTELVDHYNAVGFWPTLSIFTGALFVVLAIAALAYAAREDDKH